MAFVLYDFVSKDDAEDDKKGKGEGNEGQQSGTGLGDGEGEKATTEDLESEDIFDTAEKPGQEKQDENEAEKPETKEEQVMTVTRHEIFSTVIKKSVFIKELFSGR